MFLIFKLIPKLPLNSRLNDNRIIVRNRKMKSINFELGASGAKNRVRLGLAKI